MKLIDRLIFGVIAAALVLIALQPFVAAAHATVIPVDLKPYLARPARLGGKV